MARCAATLLALLLSLAAAPPRGAHAHPGPGFGLAKQQVNITIVEPDPPPPGRFGLTSAPVYKYSCPKVNGRQYVEWRAPLLDYESKPAGTFKMCWDLNKELLIWINLKGINDYLYVVLTFNRPDGGMGLSAYALDAILVPRGHMASLSHWFKMLITDWGAEPWGDILGAACTVTGTPKAKSTLGVVRVMPASGNWHPLSLLELRKGVCA